MLASITTTGTDRSNSLLSVRESQAVLSAVELRGVERRFGDVVALSGIDLSIDTGTTVALLGPNGAGKSTAIGIMLGLDDPTTGVARTLDLAPAEAVASGRIGAMLQSTGLPAGLRVSELLAFARRLYPAPLSESDLLGRAGLAAPARSSR